MAGRRRRMGGARAEKKLEPGPFGYIAGGAGDESTLRANREAFERRRLRPRMLAGNTERDISVEVLGTPSPVSVLPRPVGVLSIAHPDGELAPARAAAAAGRPVRCCRARPRIRSRRSRRRWATARAGSSSTGSATERSCASFVRRAEAAGYGAIVVTLDTLTLGWRPRDLRNAYLPFRQGEGSRSSQRSGLPRACSRAARGRSARRGGDDARDVPEPRAARGTTSPGYAS